VVAEGEHLERLARLGEVGVGVEQVVGRGVLGEEAQDRAGALGALDDVVLLERGVLAPVHDRVEVEVEVGALDQPRPHHRGVQPCQERALALV
jgi:hypothetical protein